MSGPSKVILSVGLTPENVDADFEAIKKEGKEAWNRQLNRI